MRFGTYYFLQAPPSLTHAEVFRRELEQMAWTEELGFDSIWLTEHHFIEYGLSVSPAVLAAAAAMRTRRVRIGLAAAILPFHDPVRLAEELAMVDVLSGGRLDVGEGRGNPPVEFEGYRGPPIENPQRFDEALEILGRARGRGAVSRAIPVAPTDAEALVEAKDAEMWYQGALRRFLIPERIDRVHPLLQPGFRAMEARLATITWDQLVAETVAFGSPDTVAGKIDELRRLGVGEVLCWMNFGGLPQERVRRSMELFAR